MKNISKIKFTLLSFILLFSTIISYSQTITYDHRSTENPYYWSKNKPYSDYWQQDVHYSIHATLVDSLNLIDVESYELKYYNNSPDTLTQLYFHLYQNAFQPNSYMENLYLNNKQKITFGKYEQQGLGTVYENLTINNETVETVLDNTILQVKLNKALAPKDSLVVKMKFKTYFDKEGVMRRRMKFFEEYGSKHFDAVHWYPSICVYDSKFGWTTEQHLDKEFYANFGTFDVEITLPSQYIVEATGELTNEKEVLPDSLRKIIDLDNFKIKPDTISKPVKEDGSTKTWKYHAINVHNFAFTCDPKYRIREQYWNEIKVVTLAMEQNAYRWQGSGDFAERITQIYSTDFGRYAWPKIVVADAKDGMEYPMLTLDNGTYPGHQGLLAHEMGHMWFYGMIGSNETYRAFMDEGFTQFLTVWSLDQINGKTRDYKTLVGPDTKRKWQLNHLNPSENRYERLYYPYIKWVLEGYDHQLNTHSSDFHGAIRHGGGYGLVYYKTGVMLYNLRYVLGEELFLSAMKNYFDTWKMKHPYPEDFRKSMISYTKVDLNWFFDEWLETTKSIDYSVEKVRATENKGEYEILFKRIGSMQMPIDFTVYTKDGKEYMYHIPNQWFQKKTDATILPKWYGWDNLQPSYSAKIILDEEIENVIIDPERYLADENLANNQWTDRCKFQFDHKIKNYPNWKATENFWRPDLWYTAQDGLKVGGHIEGNYFKMLNRYSFTAWYNTGLIPYDFDKEKDKKQVFSIESHLAQNLRKTWQGLESRETLVYDAGILKTQFGLYKRFKKRDLQADNYSTLSFDHLTLNLVKQEFSNYSLMQNTWRPGFWNTSFNFNFSRFYTYEHGNGKIDLKLRTPGILSDYNYGYLEFKTVNRNKVSKIGINTRVYGRLGYGNTPNESALNVYGANAEELYQNRITRAQGLFNQNWADMLGPFAIHNNGGLNLRGYSGQMIQNNGKPRIVGRSGLSFNGEFDFGQYTKIKGKLSNYLSLAPYAFCDAGTLFFNKAIDQKHFDKLLLDAGLGLEFQIKFYYLDINPWIIRAELPMFVNNSDFLVANRFVLGIGKAF